jgi:PAS domain S-box-containing protein
MDRPARDGDAPAVATGDRTESATVLHVEGDPDRLETTAAFLERADDRIEVVTAGEVGEALGRLEDERIDCVVSGHGTPGTDGLELLEAVRKSHDSLPFVLFVRDGDEALAGEAVAAGVTHYVPNRDADDGHARLAERVLETLETHRSRLTERDGEGPQRARGGRRERVLASLHDATRELMGAESEAEITDLVVRTARDILGMPVTGCWLYDGDERALVPVASTPESDALVGELPTYREGEGLSWAAFEAGETRVYADLSARPERYNESTPVRSEIVLPLGEYGVLNVGSTEADAFDEADVSLAGVLAANTETALTRAEREAQLGAQRELLEAGLDALDDVFCVFDADGELVRWNDRLRAVTGYTDGELAGSELSAHLGTEECDPIASIVRELRRIGKSRFETALLTRDGGRIPHEFTASSLGGSKGDPAEFVAVGRDVTERRTRLRELERYEAIVEASGDPVYTLDADGRFTFVNDALVEVVGHDEATLLGSHASTVAAPRDVERIEDAVRSLLSSSTPRTTVEFPVLTADGERVPCEAHVTLLPFEEEFRGTVGVVRDVSERTEHVRKLETLQRRTQELMHTRTETETARVAVDTAEEVLGVPLCGINTLDETGRTLRPIATLDRVRETFEGPPTYRSTSEAETDGVVWDVFRSGEALAIEDTREHGLLAEETPARSVLLHPLADRGVFIVSATEPGAFDGTDTVLVEILATALEAALGRVDRETLLREREERLERQNERLDEFASVVSHDLRNPLNVAMGSLDLAREACDANELDTVAGAHDRMEALIADLLALARAGDDATEPEPLALAEVAERCWQGVETGSVTLRIETDRVVVADRGLLERLLENLIRNSVEHGSTRNRTHSGDGVEAGGVTVTLGDVEDGFYVADDGPGIPAGERERVFESGYSTSDDGTGFGLKIVADAARNQGWDLAVTEGTDGGARFEVTEVEFVDG